MIRVCVGCSCIQPYESATPSPASSTAATPIEASALERSTSDPRNGQQSVWKESEFSKPTAAATVTTATAATVTLAVSPSKKKERSKPSIPISSANTAVTTSVDLKTSAATTVTAS